MDLVVLRRLVTELSPRLQGVRVDRVYALPPVDLAFVLGTSGAPRLWFSAEPDEPHLYERPAGHPAPDRPPAFAMAARKLLSGRRVDRLELVGDDRVAVLRCAGAGVWFELIPRRASALLVDGQQMVRAVWHSRRGRPQIGDSYTPPAHPSRRQIGDLSKADWTRLGAGGDEKAVARGLMRTLRGVTPLVAGEAAARHAAGEPLGAALRDELQRASEADTEARIYAPARLDELDGVPPSGDLVLAPYALRRLQHLVSTEFPGLRQAAAVYYPLRARLDALARAREDLGRAIDLAIARVGRTQEAVRADRGERHDPERYRRWADLLLAHPEAEPRGDHVVVPDDYAAGEPLAIPVDPSRPRVENAQRYYRKARRAERTAARTKQRAAALQRRVEQLQALRRRAGGAADPDACRELAAGAARLGARIDVEAWHAPEAERAAGTPETSGRGDLGRAEPATRPGEGRSVAPGVVAYRSSDDLDILVGRSAAANDRLTHRLASPHDWWLHAEGPGSHVVVRNPGRDREPPADTLRQAAALAAHFSQSRGATKVNVHWTQVRQLKRPKGGPPGQVLLREFRTVLAEPVAPNELLDEG